MFNCLIFPFDVLQKLIGFLTLQNQAAIVQNGNYTVFNGFTHHFFPKSERLQIFCYQDEITIAY